MAKPKLDKVRCIDIELAIFGIYDFRQYVIVPNVSNQMALVPFETDMLILSQNNYATGFEIKVSKSDLLADKKKYQYAFFRDKENGDIMQEQYYARKFKYFFYAVPKELEEIALSMIPEFIGLYVYQKWEYPKLPTFTKVKEAKKLRTQSWPESKKVELMRLGTMRIHALKLGLSYYLK